MDFLAITFVLIAICAIVTLSFRLKRGTFAINEFNVARTIPVRGILALLIVMVHCSDMLASCDVPYLWEVGSWAGCVVGMFFFLSGYGLMFSYLVKGKPYIDNFLSHRFSKLLPPFLIAMIIFIVIDHMIWGSGITDHLSRLAIGISPLPFSWYVWAMMFFYFAFYLSAKWLKNAKRVVIALWVVSTIYNVALPLIGWGGWWVLSTYAINVGMTFAFYENDIKAELMKRPRLLYLIIVLLTTFLCVLIICRQYCSICVLGFNLRAVNVINYIAPLLIVSAIYVMGMKQPLWLNFLGKHSYEIYLTQGFFIIFCMPMCSIWVLNLVAVYALTILSAWALRILSSNVMRVFKLKR